MKCELCNQEVKLMGATTKHYKGMEREQAFKEAIEIVKSIRNANESNGRYNACVEILKALKEKMESK